MPQTFSDSNERSTSQARANRWLARFAPFVYDIPTTTAAECRKLLQTLQELKEEGGLLASELAAHGGDDDVRLQATLREALPQIDGIEEDLRKRLARLAPGDAEGIVDLDALRQRLAERAAEEELGEATGAEVPRHLALTLSHGGWAAAAGMGLFGIAWTSFTVFHSVMMIGGMARAFGPAALFLLLFYSIFYAVGFGMLYGAVDAASREDLEIDGHDLLVRKTLGSWVREKRATLGKRSRAEIVDTSTTTYGNGVTVTRRSGGRPSIVISVQDADGKEIRFGGAMNATQRQETVQRINAYLKAQRV